MNKNKVEIKWNYKIIKKIVSQMIGGNIESKGSRYSIEYNCCETGRITEISNATKSTVKDIIEMFFDVEIII